MRGNNGWEDWGSPEGRPAREHGLAAIDQNFTHINPNALAPTTSVGVILHVAVVGADGGIWLRQRVMGTAHVGTGTSDWRNLGGGSDNAPALALMNPGPVGTSLGVVHTGRNKRAYLCAGTANPGVGYGGPLEGWRCSDWTDLGGVNFQDAPSAIGSPGSFVVAEKSNGASVLFRSWSAVQGPADWTTNP